MTGITTGYVEQINRTDALQLAVEGHAWLMKRGLSEPVSMVNWDNSAIVGYADGIAAGVITFSHTKWAKQLDVSIGYVRDWQRGTGLYRAMWTALVSKAQDLGAVVIMGNTAVENVPMRAVAASLGRSEAGVILKFDVPPA